MFRKLLPLAVAFPLVILVGCKKKEAGDGAAGDLSATYTINIRPVQQGDKSTVVIKGTFKAGYGAPGKVTETAGDSHLEYTEHILEMKVGEPQPTKLTRSYKVAKVPDPTTKQSKARSYQGKTAEIEKVGGGYRCTVDGIILRGEEAAEVERNEFGAVNRRALDLMIPKQPVKIGETWNIPPATFMEQEGTNSSNLDQSKSHCTCKLTRVYDQNGSQRGVIDLETDIQIKPTPDPKGKQDEGGWLKITITLDAVIDGSARDFTSKLTLKLGAHGTPVDGLMSLDTVTEETVKPVK